MGESQICEYPRAIFHCLILSLQLAEMRFFVLFFEGYRQHMSYHYHYHNVFSFLLLLPHLSFTTYTTTISLKATSQRQKLRAGSNFLIRTSINQLLPFLSHCEQPRSRSTHSLPSTPTLHPPAHKKNVLRFTSGTKRFLPGLGPVQAKLHSPLSKWQAFPRTYPRSGRFHLFQFAHLRQLWQSARGIPTSDRRAGHCYGPRKTAFPDFHYQYDIVGSQHDSLFLADPLFHWGLVRGVCLFFRRLFEGPGFVVCQFDSR